MADDTKKLNDILQGLVTTDQKVIEKINTDVAELEDKVSRGSGSYGLADINSPNVFSDGKLIDDMGASHGKSYSVTTSSNGNYCLYSGTFSDIKFGKYAMCLRLKASSTSSTNFLQVIVSNGNKSILTKNIKASDLQTANKYNYIYTTFDYEGDGATKNPLKIEIYTFAISEAIVANFDYSYVSMIIPAVFL